MTQLPKTLSCASDFRAADPGDVVRAGMPAGRASRRLAMTLVACLGACSTSPSRLPVYDTEKFDAASPYARRIARNAPTACEAARRALLSQGYVLTSARPDGVDGRKNFQPGGEAHVQLELHVTCETQPGNDRESMVFVNATQDTYALKKSNSSASVGVGPFGSLSLPFGASDDSLVKVASVTVAEPNFYKRFFALVDRFVSESPSTPVEVAPHELREPPVRVPLPVPQVPVPGSPPDLAPPANPAGDQAPDAAT